MKKDGSTGSSDFFSILTGAHFAKGIASVGKVLCIGGCDTTTEMFRKLFLISIRDF